MSSNPKDIIFDQEARNKLKKGINDIADVVSVTLGPIGRNIAIESLLGSPEITNDGNLIAKELELKDKFEDMGIYLAKQTASKIKENCGDGATTGIVLLRQIINESMKSITAGISPIVIKKGLEKALIAVLQEIDNTSIQVTDDMIKSIASVSASGNSIIGSDIAESIKKAGKNANITIEEGKSTNTIIETSEGLEIERGYLSPYFCTNHEKQIVEMQNPLILITDKKISTIQDVLPILQTATAASKELLIIADDLDSDTLATLAINKLKGILKIAAIKTPSFGAKRKDVLEDIAILTKGTFISEDKGLILKDTTLKQLGSCEKIIITKEKTVIINGQADKKEVHNRIFQLEKEMELEKEDYDKEQIQKRIANMQGQVAIIKIGAFTESEMKQKKQIYEDSLSSTKAAIEEGIVIGGGVCLLRAADAIDKIEISEEEKIGTQILKKACQAPIRQIIENSGYNSSIILEEIIKQDKNHGFNAKQEKVENLNEKQILDPAKVVKSSITNAVSIAKLTILSEALIADIDD